jgi:anti-repressor protein
MNLQQFQYDGRTVRVQVDENGKEWFCAMDITAILGYRDGRKSLRDICLEKGVSKRNTLTSGGYQHLTYIDEPNLFRLIMRSSLPKAQAFESWVFEELLPTVRKTGAYGVAKPPTQLEAARQLVAALEKMELMQPKADFYDAVTQSGSELDMHEVVKILNLGFGRNTMFAKLREAKVLMSDNVPYQEYVDAGYFRLVETSFVKPSGKVSVNTKVVVTQKGVDFLRRKFAA